MNGFDHIDYNKLNRILGDLFPNVLFFMKLGKNNLYSYSGVQDPAKKQRMWQANEDPDKIDEARKEIEADICAFINKNKIPYENKKILVQKIAKEERFYPLFPHEISHKDKMFDKLNSLNGNGNVIKISLEAINNEHVQGFEKAVRKNIIANDFANKYFEEGFLKDKIYSLEDLRNAKELGFCEHSPFSIYEAFDYYARKHYVLIRFALEFEDLHEQWKEELEKKINEKSASSNYFYLGHKDGYYADFEKTIDNTHAAYDRLTENKPTVSKGRVLLNKVFVEGLKDHEKLLDKDDAKLKYFRFLFLENVVKMIEKILESENGNHYQPTDFVTLTGKICGQLGHVRKKSQLEKKSQLGLYDNIKVDFSVSDLENIRNYCKRLKCFIEETEGWLEGMEEKRSAEIKQCLKYGTSYDKIKMLFFVATAFDEKDIFPQQSIDRIDALYRKISVTVFGDIKLSKEDGGAKDFYSESNKHLEDKHYHEIGYDLIAKEDWENFVNKFLALEFNANDEKDFVQFFLNEHNRQEILADLESYFSKGKHNTSSFIFTEYKKDNKLVHHGFFVKKLRKACHKYQEWHDKTY